MRQRYCSAASASPRHVRHAPSRIPCQRSIGHTVVLCSPMHALQTAISHRGHKPYTLAGSASSCGTHTMGLPNAYTTHQEVSSVDASPLPQPTAQRKICTSLRSGRDVCKCSFPDQIRGYIVYHMWTTLRRSRAPLKGYLGVPNCARLFHALQCAYSNRRSCKPWFGLVYSEDNLSNLLSREKFELLKQLRSTGRVLDRPTMATFGCDKADVPGLTMGLA